MKYIKAIYSDGNRIDATFFKRVKDSNNYYCTHGSWEAFLSDGQLFFDRNLSRPVPHRRLVFIDDTDSYNKQFKEAFECH